MDILPLVTSLSTNVAIDLALHIINNVDVKVANLQAVATSAHGVCGVYDFGEGFDHLLQ